MKRFVCFIFIIIFCLTFVGVASAEVYDGAELLSFDQLEALSERSLKLSERYGCDVLIYTEYYYRSPLSAAMELSDADDCVIFYVSMQSRDWAVETMGNAQSLFNSDAMDEIEERAVSLLSEGEYAKAFSAYLDVANDVLNANAQGKEYKHPKELSTLFTYILVAAALALIIAFTWVGILKGQLTSVRFQHGAGAYKKAGSFNVTKSDDVFLYKNVTRVARPKSNSSSGGRGGGSRSGKF